MITMLGVAGLLGVAFFAYLWTQLASLSDKISKAAGDVQTLTALVSNNETRLRDIFKEESSKVDSYIQQRTTALLPHVTLLEKGKFVMFCNHDGTLEHGQPPQSPDVSGMTPKGLDVDCKAIAPSFARGAIVKVLIGQAGSDTSAAFVPADANGDFPGEINVSLGFTNYAGVWVGGIVFCPFLEGQRTFKYRLSSTNKDADPKVGCIATIVGWF